MPVNSVVLTNSIKNKLDSKLSTKYEKITPEMKIFIDLLAVAVGEAVYETLTKDALVNGGACSLGGVMSGGKIV